MKRDKKYRFLLCGVNKEYHFHVGKIPGQIYCIDNGAIPLYDTLTDYVKSLKRKED